ncbi:MAG: hypothetical protein GFH25_541344n46, partial [Chloroflexi bacterium AL-N10]|nr:hypothetical protein [Chloroflexi bacterium AL-N10]
VAEDRTGCVWVVASAAHGFRRFIPGTARQLCAKTIGRPCGAIHQFVQGVFVRHTLVPRDRRAIGGGLVKRPLRNAQRRVNRVSNLHFAAYCSRGERSRHKDRVPQTERLCTTKGGAAFLRVPEGSGFLPHFL